MTFAWPWNAWRSYRRALRDLEVRHARERAALTAWLIEAEHFLDGGAP